MDDGLEQQSLPLQYYAADAKVEEPPPKKIRELVRTAAVAVVAGAVGAILAGGGAAGADRSASTSSLEDVVAATYTIETSDGRGGSAVLLDDLGYLVTSAHVVDGQSSVNLTDYRGMREQAIVVGSDSYSDIAVLRVGGNPSGALVLRDDEPVRVGETVMAIGAPFGFQNTVTRGIISGESRVLRLNDKKPLLTGLIQTDASINPGSSGGALVDEQGRLVGISTAISSRNGTNQGIGFAVPAKVVRRVMEEIIENGEVSYPRLGIEVLDTLDRSGARVSAVDPGSPAEESGIRQGDIVTSVRGARVLTSGELVGLVRSLSPGETVDISILRYGERFVVNVTLGRLGAAEGR